MGKIDLVSGKGNDRQRLRQLVEKAAPIKGKEPEEVILKGTNRAIEKVLELAIYFQGQDDCTVRIKTGSVGVVDDIVVSDAPAAHNGEEGEEGEEEVELPESRVRKATVVEVAVSLK